MGGGRKGGGIECFALTQRNPRKMRRREEINKHNFIHHRCCLIGPEKQCNSQCWGRKELAFNSS